MEDLIGVYGILDLDHWPNAPFLLLDGGVEKRWKEPYAFHNTDRGTYSGWLMQYTLSGTGWFEKNGKTYEMRPGRGFLCQIPENSRYYLHPESEEPWIFLYFHFRGSAVSYAAERLFEKTGDVFYADADSEPIRTALQMHRKLKNGYRSEPYECGVFLYQFFVLFCGRYSVRSGSRHIFLFGKRYGRWIPTVHLCRGLNSWQNRAGFPLPILRDASGRKQAFLPCSIFRKREFAKR